MIRGPGSVRVTLTVRCRKAQSLSRDLHRDVHHTCNLADTLGAACVKTLAIPCTRAW